MGKARPLGGNRRTAEDRLAELKRRLIAGGNQNVIVGCGLGAFRAGTDHVCATADDVVIKPEGHSKR